MKKGIIMEHHRNYTIVMTAEGTFHKAVRQAEADVGMEVRFEPLPEKNGFFSFFRMTNQRRQVKFVAMVAALMIAIFPLYSWYDSNQAYAYVNIDINPSIEMKVNEKMNVIELVPLNDEAEALLEELQDWKREPVDEVTVTIIETSRQAGYLNEENSVLVGVSYSDEEHDQDISKKIETFVQKKEITLAMATFVVPSEVREKAKKQKKSMNELMAESISDETTTTSTTSSAAAEDTTKVKLDKEDLDDSEKEIIETFYKEKKDKNDEKEKKKKEKGKPDTSLKNKDTGKPEHTGPPEESNVLKDKGPKEKDKDDTPPGKNKDDDHPGKGSKKQDNPKQKQSGKGNSSSKKEYDRHTPPGLAKKKDKHEHPEKKNTWEDKKHDNNRDKRKNSHEKNKRDSGKSHGHDKGRGHGR
ncbi:anti-sigma factor domain-containing protein [Thalassobacillus hwangdonensis]|uniref:Anti-sigma factor domain-containing protein n=1 Tax=Thalassobacillus hwangdonensis TaxID=546108 RepID=A0ABW3KZA2_9BACI